MADSKITQLNENTTPVLADLLPIVDDPAGSAETQKIALGSMFPRARVYNDANISIPDSAVTSLTFNQERYDSDGLHSTVSNTSRLTIPRNGLYIICAHGEFSSNATGRRFVSIVIDGSTTIAVNQSNATSGSATRLSVTTMYYLTASQYVTMAVYQNSTGALNMLSTSNFSPEFSIAMIGPGA